MKKLPSNTIFRWYTCGKCYMVKFNLISGKPSKVKDRLKHLWLNTMQVIFQIKTFHAYNKNCISVSVSPTTYYESQFTQDAISILPWFICIIYLHVTETETMFYFCNLKNHSSIMKNVFNSISIYSWKKIPLSTNIRYKCVTRKIIFFDFVKNGQIKLSFKNFSFPIW